MSSPDPTSRLVFRVRVAFAAGLLVAVSLAAGLTLLPPPVRFSGTAVGYGCAGVCYLPYIPISTQQFSVGAIVSFHWQDTNGTSGSVVFGVDGPWGQVFNETGTSGSGAFVSTGGTFEFRVNAADHQLGSLYASYSGTG